MKIFKKIKCKKDNKTIKEYKLFNTTILRKEKYSRLKIWVLGVCILNFKYKKNNIAIRDSDNSINLDRIINISKNTKYMILWVDHSLGGGTETYSFNCFASASNEKNFLRLQYFNAYNCFQISLPKEKGNIILSFHNLDDVFVFLEKIVINEIVVNNLVGYPRSLDILKHITQFKDRHTDVKVSFRGHDFQCICPSFNLLDCDNNYCNINYKTGCEDCFINKKLGNNDYEDKILKSGAVSISSWRTSWSAFFDETLDEFIVFSNEIAKIYHKTYPQLKSKTTVIPHSVSDFPIVKIPTHKDINIGILGNMTILQKGERIIQEISSFLNEYDNVNLKIIGKYNHSHPRVKVTGKYTPQKLPSIMQKEKIDIVFIPSIWPETFSYTTSEAMGMGLPVACFKLGAPYERVKSYNKGLIIDKIEARFALEQIIKFVEYIRKEK